MDGSIFVYTFGSNIFSTLGLLHKLREETSNTVIWNSLGSSSLIIFYKILGFNFRQTFEKLKKFDLTESLYNFSSILPENETGKKEHFIKTYFKIETPVHLVLP